MTPSVGPVRVLTRAGDIFEGNLKAVGQRRIWIGTSVGEMALDGDLVEEIERLDPNARVPGPSGGLTSNAPGTRVRAITPGGTFYGAVQAQQGDRVTLVLESGARITLDGAVVEPLTGKARVQFKM